MTFKPPSSSHTSFTTPAGHRAQCSDAAGDGLLEAFYAHYDRAFVLDDEKEDFDGFVACLGLNHGCAHSALAGRYGPFSELILLLRDATGANVLGGANFICFPLPEASGFARSVHLNYVFVPPEQRGRGLLRELLWAVARAAQDRFPAANGGEQLVFLEQNDPLAMDRESYRLDTAHGGTDQMQRIALWTHAGARILDFPYVQPALSATQPPARALLLSVMGAGRPHLDAGLVAHHLERFFSISVLKGAPARENPDAAGQLEYCRLLGENQQPVALLDPTDWLAAWGHRSDLPFGIRLVTALRQEPRRPRK